MGLPRIELRNAPVPGEPGRVAHDPAQAGMVGVLVLDKGRREHDPGAHPPDDGGERDRVRRLRVELGVAVELDELDRRPELPRGLPRLGGALRGGAVRRGLAAGADDQVGRPARPGLLRDDAAAAELDVVGMGAERQEGRKFRKGLHSRLHRSGRWCLGSRR